MNHPYGNRMFRPEAWEALVTLFADDRKICNCGAAYASNDSSCMAGCSANLIAAKEWIAEKILERLESAPRI
jgi:hypothetical protein